MHEFENDKEFIEWYLVESARFEAEFEMREGEGLVQLNARIDQYYRDRDAKDRQRKSRHDWLKEGF